MSEDHDPSRSSRRVAYDWYITDPLQNLSIQTSALSRTLHPSGSQATPCPEHNYYSNKQSAKVNAGLDFGSTNNVTGDAVETTTEKAILDSNSSAANVNFPQLYIPTQITTPTSPRVEQHVHTLLHPPPHAFLHGILSIQWVMGALRMSHFRFRDSDERYVLSPASSVRTEGARLGLPSALMEWLCGDQEEASPTEQGMLLTREFFEGRGGGAGE